MTYDDTADLIRQMQAASIPQQRRLCDRVTRKNAGLVYKVARSFSPSADDLDDLIQVGFIGLVKAIKNFEPDRHNAFSSFAVPKIRGEIQHYLRDNPTGGVTVSRGLHDDYRAILNAAKRSRRTMDDVAIAFYLNRGLTMQAATARWAAVKDAAESPKVVRIDRLQVEYSQPKTPPYALLAQLPLGVADVLMWLGQGMDRQSVANALGLSVERVGELAEAGIKQLTAMLEDTAYAG